MVARLCAQPAYWAISGFCALCSPWGRPRSRAANLDSVIMTVSLSGTWPRKRPGRWMSWCDGWPSDWPIPRTRGRPIGRVRQLPDRRAVRWYTTTGLVDRPVMQGRTALYNARHLLQLVAVKRRQAEGRSLAEIQAELSGATDATLRRVAAVPDEVIKAGPEEQSLAARPSRRARFWAQAPAPRRTVGSGADNGDDTVTTLAAVSLPGGALLLLPVDQGGRPESRRGHPRHPRGRSAVARTAGRPWLAVRPATPR